MTLLAQPKRVVVLFRSILRTDSAMKLNIDKCTVFRYIGKSSNTLEFVFTSANPHSFGRQKLYEA